MFTFGVFVHVLPPQDLRLNHFRSHGRHLWSVPQHEWLGVMFERYRFSHV